MAPPLNTANQGGADAAAPVAEGNQYAALTESPEDKEERIQEEEQNKEEEQLPVLVGDAAGGGGIMDRIDDWLDSW